MGFHAHLRSVVPIHGGWKRMMNKDVKMRDTNLSHRMKRAQGQVLKFLNLLLVKKLEPQNNLCE